MIVLDPMIVQLLIGILIIALMVYILNKTIDGIMKW